MTKDEYWNKFLKTGCVSDYLDYANARHKSESERQTFREDTSSTYAGFDRCDGDDSKIGTDR